MDNRRTFSREFKLAAVKKVIEQGLSYREVARELSPKRKAGSDHPVDQANSREETSRRIRQSENAPGTPESWNQLLPELGC